MTKTTRRAVLAGAVAATALPVAALPAVVMPLETDPIFAAIEAHRAAWFEFARLDSWLIDREDELAFDKPAWAKVEAEHEPERDRLWDIHNESSHVLLDTVPVTMAGIIALLDYVERVNASEFRIPDSQCLDYVSGAIEWPQEVERDDLPNWNGTGLRTMDFHEALCRHVLEALRSISRVNVAALNGAAT